MCGDKKISKHIVEIHLVMVLAIIYNTQAYIVFTQ